MTGEVTLRGKVLPIGGLKEKLLAAKRAQIKKVLIPDENQKDLHDIPEDIQQDLDIQPVKHVREVFPVLLERLPLPVQDDELIEKDPESEAAQPNGFAIPDLQETPGIPPKMMEH